MVLTMSATVAPRERSLTGLARPCRRRKRRRRVSGRSLIHSSSRTNLEEGPDREDTLAALLDGLVGGVAGVEIGEDEHGGVTGDVRARLDFLLGDLGVDGGVVLHGTFDFELWVRALQDVGGRLDLFDHGAGAAGPRRVADHGDARVDAERRGRLGGGGGNLAQLIGSGVHVDGAISEDQHALRQAHQKDGRDERLFP